MPPMHMRPLSLHRRRSLQVHVTPRQMLHKQEKTKMTIDPSKRYTKNLVVGQVVLYTLLILAIISVSYFL